MGKRSRRCKLLAKCLNRAKESRSAGYTDACVDGLKGFPEAINTVFPGTEIQLCIIHLIRNSLRYIASKDQKSFMKELRQVYTAPTEEAALIALDRLEEKLEVRESKLKEAKLKRIELSNARYSTLFN
jgi:transposase-like protein